MIDLDQLPTLGFGLWKIPKETTAETVYHAIKAGYRHFDAASDYGNEAEVGDGILGDERGREGDALVAEHVFGEGHHAVHYLLGGEDAVTRGLAVDAEADVREAAEGALVVLGLAASA